MQTGAITSYIDVAQLALYAFWIFFACLVYYLRSEDKREGYPLQGDRPGRTLVQGFPPVPAPKIFILPHGGTVSAPRPEAPSGPGNATASGNWPGAPLLPDGDPMLHAVGPAAYAQRADTPDALMDGNPKIVPLRVATAHSLASEDTDPRGMTVFGADRLPAGTVADVWVDVAEMIVRYLEVAVGAGSTHVLLPMTLARINPARGAVIAESVLARHFVTAPGLQNPDQVTLREEDRICAYFASGQLYATPARSEPLL